MATKQTGEGRPALPPVTVAKLEDGARLIERLVQENASIFGENIRKYREERRESSTRPLTAAEAAQVAAAMGSVVEENGGVSPLAENPGKVLADLQNSELRAVDEVPVQEVLLAAGLATAPAVLSATKQLVALIEMPSDAHREAREGGTLDTAIDADAKTLDYLELTEGRDRARLALDHFQSAAGAAEGEGLSLIVNMIGQALGQAVQAAPNLGSAFASLTGSPVPTDGIAE